MSQWWIAMFSEFVGTAILILLGNGVCAATSLKRMNANQPGKWVLIALGWGFAVFIGASVSAAMGGSGFLNPAALIMNAISLSVNPESMGPVFGEGLVGVNLGSSELIAMSFFVMLIFEILGAIFGQIILNTINFKFLKDKENDLLTIRGMHCTAPSYKNKEDRATFFNFAYEFIGTFVLLGAILAFGKLSVDQEGAAIKLGSLSNLAVTFVIMSIGISLGSATGYAINPARDLMPRTVFYFFVNAFRKDDVTKGICDWGYSWVPVAGPMAAGVLMGLFTLI